MSSTLRDTLLATYGPIVDSKAICKLLHFPSLTALNIARARGKLGFRVIELDSRRGVFAKTEDIAAYIDRAFEIPGIQGSPKPIVDDAAPATSKPTI